MSKYVCEICKKEFKTTQHLNQHKNKKKICVMNIVNHHLDEIVVLPNEDSTNKPTFDLKLSEILEIVKLTNQYKNKIKELELDKQKLQEQLDIIKKIITPTEKKNETKT